MKFKNTEKRYVAVGAKIASGPRGIVKKVSPSVVAKMHGVDPKFCYLVPYNKVGHLELLPKSLKILLYREIFDRSFGIHVECSYTDHRQMLIFQRLLATTLNEFMKDWKSRDKGNSITFTFKK